MFLAEETVHAQSRGKTVQHAGQAVIARVVPRQVAARHRRVLHVGPSRRLKTPRAAAAIAKPWDHILIDPGVYRECAIWRANGLILEGVGDEPPVMTSVVCDDQAIWLFRANNATVINVEFSKAHNSDNTGAAIKFAGNDLLVKKSYFHDNENGILTGPFRKSYLVIDQSRFERNGACRPVCAHAIYAGAIYKLVVRNSKFFQQNEGHHVKSRALYTELFGNQISDGRDGTASMAIDLPNGGTADIGYNLIEQGPRSSNSSIMVSIGEESVPRKGAQAMAMLPSRGLVFRNNVFTNDNPRATTFIRNLTPTPVSLRNNVFHGKGLQISGHVVRAAKPAGPRH